MTQSRTKSILKSIIMGLLLGAGIYFIPKFLLGAFVILILLRLFFRRKTKGQFRRHHGFHSLAFAEKVRSMSDDEFTTFKNEFNDRCEHSKEA